MKVPDPLFIMPSSQNDLSPQVAAGGAGPGLLLDNLEMVPEHPGVCGVIDGLLLFGHMEVTGLVQDAVGGTTWDSWLLAPRQKGTSHHD